MKRIIRNIIIPVIAGFLLFSCQEEQEVFSPILEANISALTFRAEGESKTVKVNSNRDFTVTSSAAWCKLDVINGFDNLKVTVSPTDVIGKRRTAEIFISATNNEDVRLTVAQEGIEAIISVSETSVSLANADTEFSLEIVTNLSALAFELPAWIHEKSGNASGAGKIVCYFTVDALESGETRKSEVIVKAADPEIAKRVTIPVEFGTSAINKKMPYIVEAETSLEGHEAKQEAYWAQAGIMFGSNYFIDLPQGGEATYIANVMDAGNYSFTFDVATWGTAKPLELYIDGTFCGSVSVPASDGVHISQVTLPGIALTVGEHRLKVRFQGNFDKFAVAYHSAPVAPIAVEAEDNLDGLPGMQQPYWAESGVMFGSNYFLDISNRSVSYSVDIQTAGYYNFNSVLASWGSAKTYELFIDEVSAGSDLVPESGGVSPSYSTISNVAMSQGNHTVRVKFGSAFSFDKFTLTYLRAEN